MVWAAELVCKVAKNQMPGFGYRQGRRNSIIIPHLANKNYIRVSEGPTAGDSPGMGIKAHLPLGNNRLHRFKHELNRIFNSYDVASRVVLISLIIAAREVDLPCPVGPVTKPNLVLGSKRVKNFG